MEKGFYVGFPFGIGVDFRFGFGVVFLVGFGVCFGFGYMMAFPFFVLGVGFTIGIRSGLGFVWWRWWCLAYSNFLRSFNLNLN